MKRRNTSTEDETDECSHLDPCTIDHTSDFTLCGLHIVGSKQDQAGRKKKGRIKRPADLAGFFLPVTCRSQAKATLSPSGST